MSFTLNSWKTLQNNHRMIRSRKSKGGNKEFSLPPTSNTISAEERVAKKEQQKRQNRTRKQLSYLALAILVGTVFYVWQVIRLDKMNHVNTNLASVENCTDLDIYINQDSINQCLLNRINNKGFNKLSVHQYDAALLHFESGLLIDKKSKGANLGMTYALIGLCTRDGAHCGLMNQYLDYISTSGRYSRSEIKYLESFKAGMNIDYYLQSLGNSSFIAYSG